MAKKRTNQEYQKLIEGLEVDSWLFWRETALSIGKIGKKRYISAIPQIVKHLEGKHPELKNIAAWALGNIRTKLLRTGRKITQKQPEHFALMLINPNEHPKSFLKLFKEVKVKNRPTAHWELEAKELTAMERRLK